MADRLILYYSLTDNTREAAEKAAEALGADLLRIDLKKPMPKGKFRRILRGGMLSALGKKPEITGEVEKIDAYQEIIVGTPVWAGKPAAWLNTVLERPGFAEKVTAAFTLSGGGDNEKCVRWMKERFPNIRETLSLADHYNELSKGNDERISEWIGKLKNE